MKARILYRADGGISVIHPAPKSRRKDESEAEWLERVFDKATPDGCDHDDVDESEIPANRKYRNAWTGSKGKGISIDASKKAVIDARPVYTEGQQVAISAEMRKLAEDSLISKGEL